MKNHHQNQHHQNHFNTFAHSLLNQEVEVVTTGGTYTGTIVEVESDTIFLQSRVRGQSVRMAIRTAFIVTIFQVVHEPRGPFWLGFPNENSEMGEHVRENQL